MSTSTDNNARKVSAQTSQTGSGGVIGARAFVLYTIEELKSNEFNLGIRIAISQ